MTYMNVGNAVNAGAIYCLSHGGEEVALYVRSTLLTRSAKKLAFEAGEPAQRRATAMDCGSVYIEGAFIDATSGVGIARTCLSEEAT